MNQNNYIRMKKEQERLSVYQKYINLLKSGKMKILNKQEKQKLLSINVSEEVKTVDKGA